MKIPSVGGVAQSAGVGSPLDNPHQGVGHGPKTPLKFPLVQGGTAFSSNVVPLSGMKNSAKNLPDSVAVLKENANLPQANRFSLV